MQEIWKDIKGFEGKYKISNLGNVYSIKKNIIISPTYNRKGYLRVSLYNKKQYVLTIHRLVAEAFIPNPDNLPQVNHIDGNKLNNCVENLEWCTLTYNVKEAWKNELIKGQYNKGSFPKRSILQYDIDNNFIKKWSSITEAAKSFKGKLSNNKITIWRCLNHRYETAFGYMWKYAD